MSEPGRQTMKDERVGGGLSERVLVHRKRAPVSEHILHTVALGASLLLCCAGLLSLHYGIDDIRMLWAFSTDEAGFVMRLQENLAAHQLDPRGFYYYGYFYHTLVYVIVRLFEALGGQLDARLIAWTARLVSLLSLAGLFWALAQLTFALSADRVLSALAALFVGSLPAVFQWAQVIHPDLLQCLLMVSAALVAVQWQSRAGVIWASLLAGVAFGTKYAGLPLLPFLWIPAALKEWLDRPRNRAGVGVIGSAVAGWSMIVVFATVAFLFGWLLFNSSVPIHWRDFVNQFRFNLDMAARGWGKEEPKSPLLWLGPASAQLGTSGTLLVAAGVVGLGAALWARWSGDGRKFWLHALTTPRTRALIMLSAYTIAAGAHLLVAVRMREARYTFHVIPFAAALVFAGLAWIRGRLPVRFQPAFAALLLTMLISMSWKAAKSTMPAVSKYQDPAVLAGRFIESNYERDTVILSDWFVYIPLEFQQVVYKDGVRWEDIGVARPRLLVLTRLMSGRWAWKREGTRFDQHNYRLDPSYGAQAEATARFYGMLTAWRVVWETDEVVILARNP